MVDGINPRQREILDFLAEHAHTHAYPPTVREIGQAVGLSSSSTVQNHLNTLEQRGYIRRDPTKSRTVEVVNPDSLPANGGRPHQGRVAEYRVVNVPIVGRVAAGGPILAEQNVEDHIALGPEIAGEDCFALHVRGDSMIDAGIHDGDIVVVRPQPDARNGDIVVARIEDETTGEAEATVKRFYREAGRVRLQPENRTMEPIYVRDVALDGVVVAVVRVLR